MAIREDPWTNMDSEWEKWSVDKILSGITTGEEDMEI